MSTLLTKNGHVLSGSTAVIDAVLYDTEAASMSKSAIITLTMTLLDPNGDVINGRDAQDVYDVNGGSIAEDGSVEIELSPADNPFVSSFVGTEDHELMLTWTYDTGTEIRTGSKTWRIVVEQSLTAAVDVTGPTNPVDSDGELVAPLAIGGAYTQAFGTQFEWQFTFLLDPTAFNFYFRGSLFGCADTTESWRVAAVATDLGGNLLQVIAELESADTAGIVEDTHDWSLIIVNKAQDDAGDENPDTTAIFSSSVQWANN